MANDFDSFIDDLIENPEPIATKGTGSEFKREKFTCESCNGTGRWIGGVNRHGNAKCNTCGGRGFLVTDPAARRKAQAKAAAKKVEAKIEAMKENAAHEYLLEWISGNANWNNFAASLLQQHNEGKVWSEKQVAACRRMMAKCDAKRAERAKADAERKANAPAIDLSTISEMFNRALASGYKRPMYRANDLRIKPGRGGALYVMSELRTEYGDFGPRPAYEGKIEGGKFFGVRASADDTPAKLAAIAADPKGEAIRYGQKTGTCSCCGRELTKHASIEAGIGPICAEKWGL